MLKIMPSKVFDMVTAIGRMRQLCDTSASDEGGLSMLRSPSVSVSGAHVL